MNLTFKHTMKACYTAYIIQAIINNLTPLLFIIFQNNFQLSYEKLGSLILLNFVVQLIVDILSVKYVDKLGYRKCLVAAHGFCVVGLCLLSVLPAVMSPFVGLGIAVTIYAIGGGLLEVLVSPIVDALPKPEDEKASSMSLLHSFYCWGQVCIVSISTIILYVIGENRWQVLPVMWAVVPFVNFFVFFKVPLAETVSEEQRMRLKSLFTSTAFIAALVLMLSAGASELTMSQWSSLFAEEGLGMSKVWGDLAGPCMFAVLMGIGRTIYGVWGSKIKIVPALACAGVLCIGCYMIASLSVNPAIGLIACALCGFSVSILWPGVFSMSAIRYPLGGTALFALLAMAGDMGAAVGPWLAGVVADRAMNIDSLINRIGTFIFSEHLSGLKMGILAGTIFPILLVVTLVLFGRSKSSKTN